MKKEPLKNSIISWLKRKPHWLQFLGESILENGEVTDDDVKTSFNLFLEENGLKERKAPFQDVVFKNMAERSIAGVSHPHLKRIYSVSNVNALAENQVLEFGPNLTVILGENGTGKSGYVRLMSNMFVSRGQKEILPNVFLEESPGEPSCMLLFDVDGDEKVVSYPEDGSDSLLARFSVFDTKSVSIHLEKSNRLNFTPSGFIFFDDLLDGIQRLEEMLDSKIEQTNTKSEFSHLFSGKTNISEEIGHLTAETKLQNLMKLAKFGEDEENRVLQINSRIAELKTKNVSARIHQLTKMKTQLIKTESRVSQMNNLCSQHRIDELAGLVNHHVRLNEQASKEGVSALEGYPIKGLGTKEWQGFITSAKEYISSAMIKTKGIETFPSDSSHCPFCLQALTEKEEKLIKAYWQLISNQTRREIDRNKGLIREQIKKVKSISPLGICENSNLVSFFQTTHPNPVKYWISQARIMDGNREFILENLENKSWSKKVREELFPEGIFHALQKDIELELEHLTSSGWSKELKELELELLELTDRQMLSRLIPQIKIYLSKLKWVKLAKQSRSRLSTSALTRFQGAQFKIHITQAYTNAFNSECKYLRAPSFISVTQRNSKGASLRTFQVKGYGAKSILSEGEQRAVSLADFLTEVQLNPDNSGVIFDDPVTSQDHIRRIRIAERLVELAKERQVVIFTHDVPFFLQAISLAKQKHIETSSVAIRKTGNTPGIIVSDLPWIAQNVKARKGFLRNMLVDLKRTEKTGDQDAYLLKAKTWYTLLREAWERAVEERLFKGVVERFGFGIQTQKLNKVEINSDFLEAIEVGMTETSQWVHDSGAGLNPTPPDTEKAEADLLAFENFIKKCHPA